MSLQFRFVLCIFVTIFLTTTLNAQVQKDSHATIPFSTDTTHLTVWNGEQYVPLFIKGVNMGVAVPGTFPGELAASTDVYLRWFGLIRDAGFNTMRVYTLHYPRFYEALRSFNQQNPNTPLYFFHGVWLEEEVAGYTENLFELTDHFELEMRENVDAVHGNAVIGPRQGKAYGAYMADVSTWNIGYIVGREIHPPEVLHTNDVNSDVSSFDGRFFSIQNTNASEAWLLARLDYLVGYENDTYGTQRPVSFSSWPSLDPLDHPDEANDYETMASLDISQVDFSRAKAGLFASYHAYPYYPDYISKDPKYTPFSDYLGQNSYLGYLTYLKEHYKRMPLIIAEFGVPSSWGIAHYSHSGIHHGGLDEKNQGKETIRMLQNIATAGGGGGIAFAWIDEWFKRTWITDALDFDPERRIIWHNITAAEQNFGLVGFEREDSYSVTLQSFGGGNPITSIDASSDFSFLHLQLNMPQHLPVLDTIWISLDTYDSDLGESILPNGRMVTNRAEFALMITNYSAELYITQAYDTYGKWHNKSTPQQEFRSTVTDGAPWRIVRWRNNTFENEVQYIGNLQVNRLGLPQSSKDAVRIYDDRIEVRLPWTLLNITDPSRREVLHDNKNTPQTETRISDGLSVGIFYKEFAEEIESRYEWEIWNHALNVREYLKESYTVVKQNLVSLPGNPIAMADRYSVATGVLTEILPDTGVLFNDISADGQPMSAVISSGTTRGLINLLLNGGFTYLGEEGFTGEDSFTYRVRAGGKWSEPVTVTLDVGGTPTGSGFISIYPNPNSGTFTISSKALVDSIEVYTVLGERVFRQDINAKVKQITLPMLASGLYFIRSTSGSQEKIDKFLLVR